MQPPSSVTISTLTMSLPIVISLSAFWIEACVGRVEMGRGPRLARCDGLSQLTVPIVQYLPSCLGEPVVLIQAPSLCPASAATPAAAPAHTFCIEGLPSRTVMTFSHDSSNQWHLPSHMEKAFRTSSLAQSWSHKVAPSRCKPGPGSPL